MRAGGVALVAVALGCGLACAAPKKGKKGVAKMSEAPAVEVKRTGERPGRPPMIRFLLEVTLRNAAAEPRWFVLPKKLPAGTGGGVNAVEAASLGGTGRVVVGRFLGTGGFQALLLPAGAEVTLRDFPLEWWGDPPSGPVPYEVVIARELRVGDEDARGWFAGGEPTSDAKADGSGAKEKALGTKRSPDGKELPATFVDQHRESAPLTL